MDEKEKGKQEEGTEFPHYSHVPSDLISFQKSLFLKGLIFFPVEALIHNLWDV